MSKCQRVRKTFFSVSFSLIITFVLLIQANVAGAGGIGPNQAFDNVTVLAGQEETIEPGRRARAGRQRGFLAR